jgi:DNA-binding response OmpR family regulator
MARVLVVDDEPHIVEVVRAYLERDGHEVRTAADGPGALREAVGWEPEVVVLDVMLPGRSGFDVLRDLRSSNRSPGVILVTARDEVADRVAGLELGADDYVTKPFEPRELAARVSAVLRRVGAPAPPAQEAGADAARTWVRGYHDLEIDPAAREVRRGAEVIGLTRTEFEIFDALTEQPGRVWSRPQLGERAFGEAFEAFDRTIDSHVKNLRHKLGVRPGGAAYLETVRGVGYRASRP